MVIATKILFTCLLLFTCLNIGIAKSPSKPVDLSDDDSEEDFDFDETDTPTKLDPKLKELYFAWNNFDLCKDVRCKPNEYCTIRDKVAKCIKRKKTKSVQRKKSDNNLTEKNSNAVYRGKPSEKNSNAVYRGKTSKACNPCPVVRPDFICGSDNSTYSSECRLDFHNCVHSTSIQIVCKGFCPCKPYHGKFNSEKSKKFSWDNIKNKFAKTQMKTSTKYARENDKISHSPLAIKKPKHGVTDSRCTAAELKTMGDRLLDWFDVLLVDQVRKKASEKNSKIKLPDCKPEIAWMFHHLDVDANLKLSRKELYDLEHDQREKCLRQYLENCDEDNDRVINPYEWCTCFDKKSKQINIRLH